MKPKNWTCNPKKIKYLDTTTAEFKLEKMLENPTIDKASKKKLCIYKCKSCGFFHIGKHCNDQR